MGDDLVRSLAGDLRGHLGEVVADHLEGGSPTQQRVRLGAAPRARGPRPVGGLLPVGGLPVGIHAVRGSPVGRRALERDRVERADDAVEGGEVELGAGGVEPQARLAELEAGADPQLREVGAAAVDLLEIAVDVEARHRDHAVLPHQVPLMVGEVLEVREPGVLEVEVLGEEQRGQPDLDGPRAGRAHGAARGGVRAAGVPGELAVDVAVGGEAGGKGGHRARVPWFMGRGSSRSPCPWRCGPRCRAAGPASIPLRAGTAPRS